MKIGEKLKSLRQEKLLTQNELADRCELSKGFISQLERDLTSPSLSTLEDILEVLGTNIRDFFNENQQEKIDKSRKAHRSPNLLHRTFHKWKWLIKP